MAVKKNIAVVKSVAAGGVRACVRLCVLYVKKKMKKSFSHCTSHEIRARPLLSMLSIICILSRGHAQNTAPTNFFLLFLLKVWVTFRRRSGLYRLRSAVVLGGGLSAEEMQWVERLCSGMGAAAINLANSRLLDRFCTDDIVLG